MRTLRFKEMVQNDGNMKSLKKDKKNRTQRPAAVRQSKNGGEESGGVFGAWKVGNGGERWEVGVQKFFLSYSQMKDFHSKEF